MGVSFREGSQMSTAGTIVVKAEHTVEGTRALRWAVEEAARTGAAVLLVCAFDRSQRADLALERDLDVARREARYRTQSWVVDAVADLEPAAPVVVSTPDATVEQALLAAARGADLVVLPGDDDRLAAVLLDACECPVRVVTEEQLAASG
jgi:hypothetical protein